jgi:anaerobic magnesium-protoporphyrin IX monomethyl ester cyclase
MKVLFLVPPPMDGKPAAERIFGCNYGIYTQPNIFMLYPATVLKNAGYDVQCKDFSVQRRGLRDFREFATAQDYDFIFFYTVFLSKKTDILAKDLLRRHNSRTRFVFIATEPTAKPGDFVDNASVVLRGEPEARVVQLLSAWSKGQSLDEIPGVTYRSDSRIVHGDASTVIADLDSLPFPDRTLLEGRGYCNPKLSKSPFTTMLASRGCAFNCYYCVPNSQSFAREIEYKRLNQGQKPPVRRRSPENIIAEFTALAREGYKAISFVDDQFINGKEWTRAVCDGIAHCGVEWSCLARADMLLDRDLVMAMAGAGCKYIDIGIESFSQEILDYVGKRLKVETIYPAIKNLKDAGIAPELNILLGSCALETKDTIEKTYQETLRLDVDYVLFSVCTPFPYTRFGEVAKKEGWMIKPEYEAIDPMKESFISYPHLTKAELETTIRRLYIRFYFRPAYVWQRIKKLAGYKDLMNKVKAAISILR